MQHDVIEQNPALTALLGCHRQQQCFLALLRAEADGSLIEQPVFLILLEVMPQWGSDYFMLALAVNIILRVATPVHFRLKGVSKVAPFPFKINTV